MNIGSNNASSGDWNQQWESYCREIICSIIITSILLLFISHFYLWAIGILERFIGLKCCHHYFQTIIISILIMTSWVEVFYSFIIFTLRCYYFFGSSLSTSLIITNFIQSRAVIMFYYPRTFNYSSSPFTPSVQSTASTNVYYFCWSLSVLLTLFSFSWLSSPPDIISAIIILYYVNLLIN